MPASQTVPAARDWLLDVLACPMDGGALTADAAILTCGVCGRQYSFDRRIPRMLPRALASSAQAQQDVYDTRNASASAYAHEAGFATQLVYRRWLLLDALSALRVALPSRDEDVWVYVGGGEGTQCFVLSEFGGRHISLDVAVSQLELGRWLAAEVVPRYLPRADVSRVAFVQADGETALPFRAGSADVAYGLGVLNHLPPDKWASHLKQLHDLVRPGGLVFEVVPNLECEVFRTPVFTRQFADRDSMQYWTQFVTEPAVRAAFEQAGLASLTVAKLWRLNHDEAARFISRGDGAIKKLLAPAGIRWPYPFTRATQALARGAAERGMPLPRSWRFTSPRHLVVAGRRPR